MVCILSACSAGPRNFSNDNDKLRRHNLELTHEVEDLRTQLSAAKSQINALQQKLDDGTPAIPGGIAADLPRLSRITFDRHSGTVDTDHDGAPDLIRLYVRTLDQKDRFIPVSARVRVQALSIKPGREPIVVTEQTIEPSDFDNTYRSGITGTHYTLEIAPLVPTPQDIDNLTVKITCLDATTGAEVSAESTIPCSL